MKNRDRLQKIIMFFKNCSGNGLTPAVILSLISSVLPKMPLQKKLPRPCHNFFCIFSNNLLLWIVLVSTAKSYLSLRMFAELSIFCFVCKFVKYRFPVLLYTKNKEFITIVCIQCVVIGE